MDSFSQVVDVTIRRDDPVWAASGVLGEVIGVRRDRATHRVARTVFGQARGGCLYAFGVRDDPDYGMHVILNVVKDL